MILTFLAGLAASALAPSSAVKPSPACAAAERLIDEVWSSTEGQPPISSSGEPRFKSPVWKRPRELVQGGWSGPAPSVALLDQWERDAGSTATSCANVRAYADSKAIALPPGAGPDAERTAVGLPAVDRAGVEALVQVQTHRRPMGGGVYLYLAQVRRAMDCCQPQDAGRLIGCRLR